MMSLTPYCVLSIALCTITVMFDGISIGSGDYAHLPRTNLLATCAALAVLFIAGELELGLKGVWSALVTFFAMRFG